MSSRGGVRCRLVSGVEDDDGDVIAGCDRVSTGVWCRGRRRQHAVAVSSWCRPVRVSSQVWRSGVEGPWCRPVSRGVRPDVSLAGVDRF